jgi:hypothetical protein
MDGWQWKLNINFRRRGSEKDDLATRRLHFDALCRRVESLQGIASACVAVRCQRPGCPAGPTCLCGRHAVAAFKIIGQGHNRRVLCRNSHGKKSPIIEVRPVNLAWWMDVEPNIVRSWGPNGKEAPVPAQTQWFGEWRAARDAESNMLREQAAARQAAGAMVHKGVTCDGRCAGGHFIVGRRFKKRNANYDLCEDCFRALARTRPAAIHSFDAKNAAKDGKPGGEECACSRKGSQTPAKRRDAHSTDPTQHRAPVVESR